MTDKNDVKTPTQLFDTDRDESFGVPVEDIAAGVDERELCRERFVIEMLFMNTKNLATHADYVTRKHAASKAFAKSQLDAIAGRENLSDVANFTSYANLAFMALYGFEETRPVYRVLQQKMASEYKSQLLRDVGFGAFYGVLIVAVHAFFAK